MSKYIDLINNVFGSLIVAIFTLVGTYAIRYLSISGNISFSKVLKDNTNFTSIVIENYTKQQSDFKLWLIGNDIRIFGSSGESSVKLEIEPYRSGQVLSVGGVAATSTSTVLVEQPAIEPYLNVKMLKPDSGYQIRSLKNPAKRIDYLSPMFMAAFAFVLYFSIALHQARQRREWIRENDLLIKNVEKSDEKAEDLQQNIANIRQNLQRNRLYMGKFNRFLQLENDFWRACITNTLSRGDVSKKISHELLGEIAKKFNTKNGSVDYQSQDLNDIVEILVDDIRRKRSNELSRENLMDKDV